MAVAVSAANTHDSLALIPLVQAVPAIRSRRGPRRRRPAKLHADKGYDYPYLRTWLRVRRISSRIACRGIETSTRLGRHRWVIERSFAWLTGYRRLTIRYERFRPAVHRIPHPRRRAHLRQEAHQMRQALSRICVGYYRSVPSWLILSRNYQVAYRASRWPATLQTSRR